MEDLQSDLILVCPRVFDSATRLVGGFQSCMVRREMSDWEELVSASRHGVFKSK
jgi:hypothetical protein